MNKTTAVKKIQSAVKKALSGEAQAVQDYFVDAIYSTFVGFENDCDSEYTSAENLKYALDVNLIDEFSYLLAEARAETLKQ